jgi:hypothetical protein
MSNAIENTAPELLAPHAAAGSKLIEIRPKSKRPVGIPVIGLDGKPVMRKTKHGPRPKTTWKYISASEAQKCFERGGNVAWVIGRHHVVLDFDPRAYKPGIDTEAAFLAAIGLKDWKQFARVRTPGGGIHVIMQAPQDAMICSDDRFPGLDVKRGVSYVLIPGSIHPNGGVYTWEGEVPLHSTPAAPLGVLEALKLSAPPMEARGEAGDDDWGILSEDQIEEALSHIEVEQFNHQNEEWFRLMASCHWLTAGDGGDVFLDWSAGDDEYSDEAMRDINQQRWNSLSKEGQHGAWADRRIRGGLLYKKLSEAGVPSGHWPQRRASRDFMDVTAEENAEACELISIGLANRETSRALAVLSRGGDLAAKPGDPDFIPGELWPDRENRGTKIAPQWVPTRDPENAFLAMRRSAAAGLTLRYNTFAARIEVGHYAVQSAIGDVSDRAVTLLRSHFHRRYGVLFPLASVREALETVAHEHPFDPVRAYLDAVHWDGVPRIDTWLSEYGGAEDTLYSRAVARKFLIAAVRRAREPGVKFDTALVTIGEQGARKSTAVQVMAGAPFRHHYGYTAGVYGSPLYCDTPILDTDERKQLELMRGVWVYELGELAGYSKAQIDKLKAFLARQSDKARGAYQHYEEIVARRSVFWATTNDTEIFVDHTGNRRWWPVTIKAFDIPRLLADADQLWAEAAAFEAKGEPLHLPANLETLAREVQATHMEHNEFVDRLAELNGEFSQSHPGVARVSNATIIRELEIRPGELKGRIARLISAAMRDLGWTGPKLVKIAGAKTPVRGYERQINRGAIAGPGDNFDVTIADLANDFGCEENIPANLPLEFRRSIIEELGRQLI